jgi:hypothetical protein
MGEWSEWSHGLQGMEGIPVRRPCASLALKASG